MVPQVAFHEEHTRENTSYINVFYVVPPSFGILEILLRSMIIQSAAIQLCSSIIGTRPRVLLPQKVSLAETVPQCRHMGSLSLRGLAADWN